MTKSFLSHRPKTCREQMAKGIMNDFVLKVPMEIEARGLVVQFPEPLIRRQRQCS